ncbi:type II secretion system F family protein [Streptomyces sp. DSM 44915]|uniref:Type II secretion system F family protein n=1 Tax=Streptomyces chisholmiae TaxID=3075540 RepID=A0ABU2JQB7_9ACTN|nr:type II secretion system F family protein [Streptomyces sp. DSM 44915]MDT0266919.1 type II secretion system F family protein [Streptomyces sp. DSM 44915]
MTAETLWRWASLALLALALPVTVRELRASLRTRGRLAALRGRAPARSRAWRWPGRRGGRGAPDPALPLVTELLTACLAAGAEPGAAARAVGVSVRGPVGAALLRASAELRLGGEPAVVWGRVGRLPGAERLASRLVAAGSSGAPLVSAFAAEAAETRARRGRAAQAAARRAAVLVAGPLGLCFLPAFLLLGVAPVVIALAQELS